MLAITTQKNQSMNKMVNAHGSTETLLQSCLGCSLTRWFQIYVLFQPVGFKYMFYVPAYLAWRARFQVGKPTARLFPKFSIRGGCWLFPVIMSHLDILSPCYWQHFFDYQWLFTIKFTFLQSQFPSSAVDPSPTGVAQTNPSGGPWEMGVVSSCWYDSYS